MASLLASTAFLLEAGFICFWFVAGGEGGGDSVASLSSTTAFFFEATVGFFAGGEGGGDSVASLSSAAAFFFVPSFDFVGGGEGDLVAYLSCPAAFFDEPTLAFFAGGEDGGEGVSSSSTWSTSLFFSSTGSFLFFLGAVDSSSEGEGEVVTASLSSPAGAAVFFAFPLAVTFFAVGADFAVPRRLVV